MKLSPIDRRLAAHAHQAQIALVRRTDRIAAKVAACYAQLATRLVQAAAGGHAGLLSKVHSACAQAKTDAYHVLETEYPELIRQQHQEGKANLLRTVPKKWWKMLVHPKHLHEDVFQEAHPLHFHDELAPARPKTISPEEYKAKVEEVVFPPLPPAKVNEILTSPGYNKLTWQERFRRYVPTDQDAIARELTDGVSSGEGIPALRKRMETIVAGPRYKAERIARTEGRRVAEQGGMEAYKGLGDMLEGMQISAIMDAETRPEHEARNGKIYRQSENGEFYDDAGTPLPELPDEPNCRCTAIPVLKMPKEFEDDPRVQAEFATAQGDNVPDPAAYTEWFANADEQSRRDAVGTRRYQIVDDQTPEGHRPEWHEFINPEGSLVPLKELKSEGQAARDERKLAVKAMLVERERLYREVAGKGFVNPLPPGYILVQPATEPSKPVVQLPVSHPIPTNTPPVVQTQHPRIPYNSTSIQDAERHAKVIIPGLQFVNYSGIETYIADAINAAASQISKAFGISVEKIGSMQDLGYAMSNPMAADKKGIGINKQWWNGSPEAQRLSNYLKSVIDNPHKANCSRDAYSYVAHEMAHVLHGSSTKWQSLKPIADKYRRSMKQQGIRDELGGYAWDAKKTTNKKNYYKETWAEAFSAYWSDKSSCNPKTIAFVEEVLKVLYPQFVP